ncbi:MAG TPA: ATP-binding protein [Lacunisphaera sp.]
MKLKEVKLQNFRGYKNETTISFDDFTVLIGRNDAGKSSVLDALNVFFNDVEIDKDDATAGCDPKNVRISCVFSELPGQLVLDDQHPTSLQAEHLLRQDGCLEICRVFNCSAAKGKQARIFAKANHPRAAGCADLLGLKIKDLKARALERQVNMVGVNQTIKTELRRAIWAQTAALDLGLSEVELSEEAGKTAWEQIQGMLPVFALFKSDRASTDQDEEAQDPMKAAIKEAVKQHEQGLANVIAEVKTELERVAKKTVEKIQEMNPELAKSLNPQVKNKNWDSLFTVSLTGEDGISINKRGSGTRRLVLLNFFRAKAEDSSFSKGTGAIYAVEEPETSQHPNHQLMLLDAFQDLTDQSGAQVILTTHTPTLARKVDRGALRLVRLENNQPVIHHGNVDATLEAIKSTLGVLADHDVKVFVGVEGKWDIEFLKRISKILNAADATIPDLGVEEVAGRLLFVPLGGSSMELWANRLAGLNRPELYLTDRDAAPPAAPKYNDKIIAWNARANCNARCTDKRELENYLHPTVIQLTIAGFPAAIADFDDVPLLMAEAVHVAAPGATPWATVLAKDRKEKASNAKKKLNQECVDRMTPALLALTDPQNFVTTFLRDIAARLAQ